MTDTAQLRAMLAKMTPGEWSVAGKTTGYISCSGDPKTVGYVHIATVGAYQDKELLRFNRDRWDADAAGIVALVNAAEPMLAEIEALRAEVARLHKQQAERRARLKEARMIKEGYL